MHKLALRLSLPLIAVTVLPGCLEVALIQALENRDEPEPDVAYSDTYYDSYDDSYDDTYVSETSLDIRNAQLSGDMGDVQGFWDDDPMYSGYSYDSYASIEIHAAAQDGSAAMVYFNVEGGLDHPDLQPGAHLEFSGYDYYGTENGLYVSMIGCSGPREGDWYFDQSPDDVVVDVSATPEGNTVIDFTAGFSGQTVVGSAELGPPQAQ